MNLKHAGTSKTTKTTKKIPTGLVADWQNKITKTSDDTGTQNHQRASSPLGGLADDELVANDLSIAMIATRIAKMMYIFFQA